MAYSDYVRQQLEFIERQKNLFKAESYVYAIQEAKCRGKIKIGVSVDPRKRYMSLRTGTPIKLRVLSIFPGDYLTEAKLHRRFHRYWVRGEWFTPDEGMLRFFQNMNFKKHFIAWDRGRYSGDYDTVVYNFESFRQRRVSD